MPDALGVLGCTLIAVSNTSGAIHSEAGIDPDSLLRHLQGGGRLVEYPHAAGTHGVEAIAAEDLVGALIARS